MRFRVNRWSQPLTVPLMVTRTDTLLSSWEIAGYAQEYGTGWSLRTADPDVAHWNGVSDRILELGRVRISRAIQHHPEALKAALPGGLRWMPGGRLIARYGAHYMLKTYPVDISLDQLISDTELLLTQIRSALNGKRYLLGEASYADLAIASSLQMIRPVAPGIVPLNPDLHDVWSLHDLSESFADLCSWRDETMRNLNAPLLG